MAKPLMGPVIYHVDEQTNIYVGLAPDRQSVALTVIIEGEPTVTICYSVEELLTFNWLLLHSINMLSHA